MLLLSTFGNEMDTNVFILVIHQQQVALCNIMAIGIGTTHNNFEQILLTR